MNVSDDTPSVNYVEYFSKQLPIDLAKMAVLRDELEVRQGAMTAVQDAVADREAARKELAAARAEIAELQAVTKQTLNEANTSLAESKAKAKELAVKEKAFNALIGQIMKATQGKANPQQVNKLLTDKLNQS